MDGKEIRWRGRAGVHVLPNRSNSDCRPRDLVLSLEVGLAPSADIHLSALEYQLGGLVAISLSRSCGRPCGRIVAGPQTVSRPAGCPSSVWRDTFSRIGLRKHLPVSLFLRRGPLSVPCMHRPDVAGRGLGSHGVRPPGPKETPHSPDGLQPVIDHGIKRPVIFAVAHLYRNGNAVEDDDCGKPRLLDGVPKPRPDS